MTCKRDCNCTGICLTDECVDISGGVFDVEFFDTNTDMSQLANAELLAGGRSLALFSIALDNLKILDYDGYQRRIRLVLPEIPDRYIGRFLKLQVRPYADPLAVYTKKLTIIDNHAKRN